jgi:GWxTD domain-containing protein
LKLVHGYTLAVASILFLAGCRSKNVYTSRPQGGEEQPEIRSVVYHNEDSLSLVFLEVNNEKLLYKRADTSQGFYANLRVFYQLMIEPPRRLTDSGSFILRDLARGEQVPVRNLYGQFRVAAKRENNYHLSIEVYDMNRRTRYNKSIQVNKQGKLGSQNFLVKVHDTVAFRRYFLRGEEVQIQYADANLNRLTIEYFSKKFGPALPPFSARERDELKYKPDSVFTLEKESAEFRTRMPEHGYYHLKPDANELEGLSLYTYDEHFPSVGNTEEMIDCARYIMSREEFDECRNAADRKAAIDKFWLGIGGSNERARELLKKYYGRVQESNRHFSSYMEGWKTDRGMIFIVFGQPANIYKSKKDEVWVYGNEANPAALRFVFNRTKNPYSENDFILERSQFYKDPWYSAVDYWRQGHVYYDGRR